MTIKTSITKLFGIEHPVLLAPMGSVAGGALAAAVSRAGGLGIIGGGYGDRGQLQKEFEAAGNTPVGVGFITWSLAKQSDLLDLALDRAPKALFLSFGELGPFAPKIKRAGVRLIAQVQTVAQAKRALGEGADVLVAQGTEAGGHGATRATFPLVPAVVDIAGATPVLAAGGIADGRGLAAALMLGAAGVVCGTVFYAAAESTAHPNAKRTTVAASGDNTERGTSVDVVRGMDWPVEWNIRTLRNSFTDRWSRDPAGLMANLERERERFLAAREAGDTDVAAVIVGEGVDLIRDVLPAGEIVRNMVSEAEGCIRQASDLLSANS
jgi:nitronate monooxygenase